MFRAYEPGRDRLVAVKVFRLDLTSVQSDALVVELERLVAKGVTHPSIAAPIAAGLENGAAFLAQEYAVGESLDVALRERGPLALADAVHLVGSLAAAIDAAADAGVTHGSLHPRDIIVSGDGARITGFGVASALSTINARVPLRQPYSGFKTASDVYSLAAIAFEAISGRRLSGPNLDEFEHERGPVLRGAFSAALALDPDLRPARAGDFASALRDAAEPSAVMGEVGVAPLTFDPATLDRYADVGAAEDLRMDFLAPEPEQPAPFPASWSAQPPKVFQRPEPELESTGRGRLLAILLIGGVVAGLVVGYFFITSRTTPQPAKAADTKPSVSETVVDLPATVTSPPAPPVPVEKPSLPAPTPSRPASGAAAKPPARSSPVPARGNLVIRSSPANADVTVNGQASGKTPTTMRDLPLGSYTIRVARDGYTPEQKRVQLTARRATAAMSFSLRAAPATSAQAPSERTVATGAGIINVRSRPSGARVFVNDRLIGSTPLAIPGMPAGPASVRIEMDGYRTWTTTVHVNAGESAPVNASLDRR